MNPANRIPEFPTKIAAVLLATFFVAATALAIDHHLPLGNLMRANTRSSGTRGMMIFTKWVQLCFSQRLDGSVSSRRWTTMCPAAPREELWKYPMLSPGRTAEMLIANSFFPLGGILS